MQKFGAMFNEEKLLAYFNVSQEYVKKFMVQVQKFKLRLNVHGSKLVQNFF